MISMTGFGRAELKTKLGRLVVEITSLNNRFLDFSLKAPRQFSPLEVQTRELVAAHLNRGKIVVNVLFEESDLLPEKYVINRRAAAAYYRQLVALRKELGLSGQIAVADLLFLPEIARPEYEVADHEQCWQILQSAVRRALKQLVAMRRREGQATSRDMKQVLGKMLMQIKDMEKKSADSVGLYRQRLTARIKEILTDHTYESVRLEEEIALFADRSDVTEEFGRLRSHIDQFGRALRLRGPVGKRLNFILQEMNREANTIGSKCSDFAISSTAILLKGEIEKLREMAQNVE